MAKTHIWMTERIRGFYLAAYLLFGLLVVGTVGYELIEGWGLLDSFYMTVITISTVGYGEVNPLSREGVIFTTCLIIGGMSVTVYAFGVIGQTALEGELFKLRRLAKMEKKIDALDNHTIVCGFGRLAHFVIDELRDHGEEIVVVEKEERHFKEIESEGLLYVNGNAHEDEILLRAGIRRAKTLLAIVPSDAENVFITLTARNLNPTIQIVARTEQTASESKLRRAGADQVISPYRVSGSRIVQNVLHQHVNDFLEIATGSDGTKLALEQVVVPPDSPLVGLTLETAALRRKAGVNVAAIISPTGKTHLSPSKDEVIESGARIFLFGETTSFKLLAELMSPPA
ncbi:potassium channel protein [bacterium]|nr:potassium channel protein [bacterium]